MSRAETTGSASGLARRFGDALRVADGAGAETIARRVLRSGVPLAVVHGRVITPAMHRIGDLWEQGAITVADEHLATTIAQRVLASTFTASPVRPGQRRERILLASPTGEHHALGMRMVADVLELAGFVVTHLGPDVPTDALAAAVRRHRPHIVGLTLTMATGGAMLEDAIDAVLEAAPATRIMLGGQGVSRRLIDRGFAHVGSVEEVVDVAERLMLDETPHERHPRRTGQSLGGLASPPETQGIGTLEDRFAREAAQLGDLARESARAAGRYRAMAFEDPLTGLPNRRAFDDAFVRLADEGSAYPTPVGVIVLDLDRFKAINDRLGHDVGDRALQRVATAMRSVLDRDAVPARLGGDEFAVLLPGAGSEAAVETAGRIRTAIALSGGSPSLTASLGVAVFDGDRRATLIRADQSLYDAKRAGRDGVGFAPTSGGLPRDVVAEAPVGPERLPAPALGQRVCLVVDGERIGAVVTGVLPAGQLRLDTPITSANCVKLLVQYVSHLGVLQIRAQLDIAVSDRGLCVGWRAGGPPQLLLGRQHVRAPLAFAACARRADGTLVESVTRNVSASGMLLAGGERMTVGEEVEVRMTVSKSEPTVVATARVMRIDDEGSAGLHFTGIDRESVDRLQLHILEAVRAGKPRRDRAEGAGFEPANA